MTLPPPPATIAAAELARRLEKLALLPAVVTELLSLDPEANEYFDRLLHLAERDPSFAARVLRCANSAASAPLVPIVSLREAFLRLGTQQCAQLVLAVAVTKVFTPHSEGQRLLWVHSLQTALFSRMLCVRVRDLRRVREQAYVCGLLHDIGRFVQFEDGPGDSLEERVDLERSTQGYDHAELGWSACTKWGLPTPIGEVIRHHHDSFPAAAARSPALVNVVQWADSLSIALLPHPGHGAVAAGEFARWLAASCPGIGPAWDPADAEAWPREVPGVHAESLKLARQLQLL